MRAIGHAGEEEGLLLSCLGGDRTGRENVRAEISVEAIPELPRLFDIEVVKFAPVA